MGDCLKTAAFDVEVSASELEEIEKEFGDMSDEDIPYDSHDDVYYVDCMDQLRHMIMDVPLLNAEEEIELANRVKEGDKNAFDTLVMRNMRLVMKIAHHYDYGAMDYSDLVQEGTLGLMSAVRKYDPSLGYRFSTYATWWIKQGITRSLATKTPFLKTPVHITERINKYVYTQRKFLNENGREATDEEIAEILNVSLDKIREVKGYMVSRVSLDSKVSPENDDSTLGDFIEDNKLPDPESSVIDSMLHDELINILKNSLNERECRIMMLRFGFIDNKKYTLEDIGNEYGVTRERIRQIEISAIRKLRKPGNKRILREYYKG